MISEFAEPWRAVKGPAGLWKRSGSRAFRVGSGRAMGACQKAPAARKIL